MPECSVYDSVLTYTLRPGAFDFCNREYCNHYRVNHLGLRDDEASLQQPKIIVLGDSYALGWGVAQNETFAQLLEQQTGLKTLNAGVSSYGTARELMLLDRLDTLQLQYLVVQYSNNDYEENLHYLENNFKLNILSKEQYENECSRFVNRKRYTPFIFTIEFLKAMKEKIVGKNPNSSVRAPAVNCFLPFARAESSSIRTRTNPTEAEAFLKILTRKNLEGVTLIALNLSHYKLDTQTFIQELSRLKEKSEHGFIRDMHVLDASTFIEKSDYYIIDDHLRSSGHRKVAASIVEAIHERAD